MGKRRHHLRRPGDPPAECDERQWNAAEAPRFPGAAELATGVVA